MFLRICLVITILAGAGVVYLSHFQVRPHVQEIIDHRDQNAKDRDMEKAAKMKALAVTARKRSSLAPDVPSVAELGLAQLESLAWIGLLAPAATPPEVLEHLSAETMRRM